MPELCHLGIIVLNVRITLCRSVQIYRFKLSMSSLNHLNTLLSNVNDVQLVAHRLLTQGRYSSILQSSNGTRRPIRHLAEDDTKSPTSITTHRPVINLR